MNEFTPNLTRLCLETRKIFQKGENSEGVLISSPGEGGFCSLETKHARRTTPTLKLFDSTRLQDKGHNPQKFYPVFESR
jgi:hypothetical protein